MKELLKGIGSILLVVAIFAGAILIGVMFIKGGLWLSEKLLPILIVVSSWAFVACLLVLVPLAVFHPTRALAGVGLFIASYIFGVSGWMMGLLLTYSLWGIGAVVLGLFLFGVGVVPMALIATLFKGLWEPFFSVLLMVVATYGSRAMAGYVIQKQEEENYAQPPSA